MTTIDLITTLLKNVYKMHLKQVLHNYEVFKSLSHVVENAVNNAGPISDQIYLGLT